MPPSDTAPVVELVDVGKTFGGAVALRGVSLTVAPGEVHALAGENGAGKSTLLKILTGVHGDYEGTLRVGGAAIRFRSPREAARAGIAAIHQELSLVGSMSVVDNLFLGRERAGRLGVVDRDEQRRMATRWLADVELHVDRDRGGAEEPFLERAVETLPISVQQSIEIARALAQQPRVLVLDEPTSALTAVEARELIGRVRRLADRGTAVLYVSHRLEEVLAIVDRVTVLRDGRRVATRTNVGLDAATLVADMTGGARLTAAAPPATPPPVSPRAAALVVEDLRVAGRAGGRDEVDGLSWSVEAGEIVGLFGLRGAGAAAALEGIYGCRGARSTGRVLVAGAPVALDEPRALLEAGVVLLTSDRKGSGLVFDLDGVANATLACLDRFTTAGWLRHERARGAARAGSAALALAADALDRPVRTLSGGNQQKVYLLRCVLARPRVLLLCEPTRGVDVAAKAEIHAAILAMAAGGAAVVVATSEVDELVALARRIVVVRAGRAVARFDPGEATPERVLAAAMNTESAA